MRPMGADQRTVMKAHQRSTGPAQTRRLLRSRMLLPPFQMRSRASGWLTVNAEGT